MEKERMGQREAKIVGLEDPGAIGSSAAKIESAICFDFFYGEVNGMYSEIEWRKPGIDPVALFKIVFIQYLFGIRSKR